MGTMENKLSYLLKTKSEIKNAIISKGVEVTNEDTFRSYANKIKDIKGQIIYLAAKPAQTVNFRDYDGTILFSYTKEQFLALTELPALPERYGLICQGWNYNLEDAQSYVSEDGVLEIGATYITDDGKTRLYICIAEKGRMSVPLYFSQTVGNGVVIDWGDGSTTETFSGTGDVKTTHIYASEGDYIITLDVANGCTLKLGLETSGNCIFGSNNEGGKVYWNMLKRVEIGQGVTTISNFAFNGCSSLSSITIPQGITSIGRYVFGGCSSLSSVAIPNGITSIGEGVFHSCSSLSSVTIPKGVTSLNDNVFYNCSSLSSVTIPKGVTSIGNAFNGCSSLSSVTIPKGVISIGNGAFSSCLSLSSVAIPQGVTSIGNAFGGCSSLSSVAIPQGVTSIGDGVFRSCSSLSSVTIPQGITSIGNNVFYECPSLSSVTIPNGVTSIGSSTFFGCYGLAIIDFRTLTSVPSLSSTGAFSSIPSDCKIIIPDALYDQWIAATNWSSSSIVNKIVKASVYEG